MARGRPLGSKNQRKLPQGAPEPQPLPTSNRYRCLYCGAEKAEAQFYSNRWSLLWAASGKKVLICKSCLTNFHKKWVEQYGPEAAAEIICHYLDLGFDKIQINGASDATDFNIGEYVKAQNLHQLQFQTYADTIAVNRGACAEMPLPTQQAKSVRWSKEDKQNKAYVVQVVGYEPFSGDDISEADMIFCYNTLASYLYGEGVQEDGHKIQCVIQLTYSHLQCRKIDMLLVREQQKQNPDANYIKTLSQTKRDLQSSISTIAKDNNISSAHSANAKAGKNTLSQKLRDMQEDDYWASKQNLFDAKTSAAILQIADLSHKSILDQLGLDDNDLAQMVKEQREMLKAKQAAFDELEEKYRNLYNQLADGKPMPKKGGGG